MGSRPTFQRLKARHHSRQCKQQLKDLEDSNKKYESDLQEPWAESHKLLNKLKEPRKSKDDTITTLRSTLAAKEAELLDVTLNMQVLHNEAQMNERTNKELQSNNVGLTSRNKVLESDLKILVRLTARNTELNKSLEESQRELKKAQEDLAAWSGKHSCQICMLTEADRITGCGHLFCKKCLDEWDKEWCRKSDPYGNMQEIPKGILTCQIIDSTLQFPLHQIHDIVSNFGVMNWDVDLDQEAAVALLGDLLVGLLAPHCLVVLFKPTVQMWFKLHATIVSDGH